VSAPLDELGAHISIAGGVALAPARGRALGCGAIQVFVKNQRQWAAPPLTAGEARAFRAARRRAGIRHAFAHGSYLVNLGCPERSGWRQALRAFTDELRRAEALGLDALVVHPGSHLGAGVEGGLDIAVAGTHHDDVLVVAVGGGGYGAGGEPEAPHEADACRAGGVVAVHDGDLGDVGRRVGRHDAIHDVE